MSPPLQDALDLFGRELADPRSVLQAELGCDGALLLRVSHYRGERWLRQEGSRFIELEPSADSRIPLAATLAATHEEGPPEVLAYRPGRRLVIRQRRPEGVVVRKGYRARRWRAAAERHRIAAAATSNGGFKTPRLVASESACASLELEHLDGRTISLSESGADRFFAIGSALRSLQERPVSEELPRFGPRDELEVLVRWADRCRTLTGWLPERWDQRLAELDAAVTMLPAPTFVLAHRDLHDGQLLDLEAGVGLLDFDLLSRADIGLDPANLLAHLTLRRLQGRATEAAVLACALALIEGLDRGEEAGWWTRLRFYQTTSFYRLAFVYNLRPQWRDLPSTLLEYGRRCLEEVV